MTFAGIPTPIVAAPMAGASGGALAAQTSAAGAFGFVGAGKDTTASSSSLAPFSK